MGGVSGPRSEEGVADPQRPAPGRPELGQLGVDVDRDRAEEVDVLACAGLISTRSGRHVCDGQTGASFTAKHPWWIF